MNYNNDLLYDLFFSRAPGMMPGASKIPRAWYDARCYLRAPGMMPGAIYARLA